MDDIYMFWGGFMCVYVTVGVCVYVGVCACVGGVCVAHLALLARCRLPRYVLRQPFHLVWHLSRLRLHPLRRIVVR